MIADLWSCLTWWMVSLIGLVRLRSASVFGCLLLVNFSLRSTKSPPSTHFVSAVKHKKGENFIDDAESILLRTNKYDKYTGSIYSKTVLSVVKHLIRIADNSNALTWLDKLDFNVLNNVPFTFRGQKYPSDKKVFFILYADVLVQWNKHIEYLESCLSCVGIENSKQLQFKKYIIETISYTNYYGEKNITRLRFALYIKYFKEEIDIRMKKIFSNIYNSQKITSISDLSSFEFCPVSFAINQTYEVPSNSSWERDEWLGDKKHLFDRFNIFQKTKSVSEAFIDSTIEIDEKVRSDFEDVFNSKLVINNYDGSNKTFYSNSNDTVRGNPDYVFENAEGKRFVVVEKFTRKISEDKPIPYYNDLVKLYGYIFELEKLNIDFGYLIYWYWQVDEIQMPNGNPIKKIRLKSYDKFPIEKSIENKTKLLATIDRVNRFKETKTFSVDGDRISYPNKCLNCSVVSYCNHKTGRFDNINLPYDVSEIVVDKTPSLNI